MTRTHEWPPSRLVEWARRPGASPPMRITASWFGSFGSTEYKYVARWLAPIGKLPSDRPAHGLCLSTGYRRPTLCGRPAPACEQAFAGRQGAKEERSSATRFPLDFKSPIQVMGHRAGASLLHRQPRLGAVERLDLAHMGICESRFSVQDVIDTSPVVTSYPRSQPVCMTRPVSEAASNSHPVAAIVGCTNIPLASGKGSEGRDHSFLRLF